MKYPCIGCNKKAASEKGGACMSCQLKARMAAPETKMAAKVNNSGYADGRAGR
jgi:hypothetical protein